MPATLAITDNLDGTGVATIGNSSGASNRLYHTPWTGQVGELDWTLVGTRTGDGRIDFEGPGWWLWRLDCASAGGIAASIASMLFQTFPWAAPVMVYEPIIDPTVSIMSRCLEAIRLRIVSLQLSGVADVNVRKRWVPRQLVDTATDPVPAVIICPLGHEDFPEVLAGQDDIGLPVLVMLVDKQNQDLTANLDRNTKWRQLVLSAIRCQRLAGVPEVWTVKPLPMPTLNLQAFSDDNLFLSPLAFSCLTRTTRG